MARQDRLARLRTVDGGGKEGEYYGDRING